MKGRIARRLLKLAKELLSSDEITAQTKSAVKSLVRGVNVGITKDGKHVIAFLSKDYDNKGNVRGPFVDITKIAGKDGFYMAAYEYDEDALKELGYETRDRDNVLKALGKFKRS